MVINLLLFSLYLKKSDPVHVATYKPNRDQSISDQFVRLEIYKFIDILSPLPKELKSFKFDLNCSFFVFFLLLGRQSADTL